MNIYLTRSAEQDLLDGYGFYERQAPGVGTYFLDSLFADIDSLVLYAGIPPNPMVGFTEHWPSGFLMRCTTKWTGNWSLLSRFLTAAGTRSSSEIRLSKDNKMLLIQPFRGSTLKKMSPAHFLLEVVNTTSLRVV